MGLGQLAVSRHFLVRLWKERMPSSSRWSRQVYLHSLLRAHAYMLCVSIHSGEVGNNVDGLGTQ